MGLPADTPPDDLLLVERVTDSDGRFLGVQPARDVVKEYERVHRWCAEEAAKRGTA
jgi:hypothetical protein